MCQRQNNTGHFSPSRDTVLLTHLRLNATVLIGSQSQFSAKWITKAMLESVFRFNFVPRTPSLTQHSRTSISMFDFFFLYSNDYSPRISTNMDNVRVPNRTTNSHGTIPVTLKVPYHTLRLIKLPSSPFHPSWVVIRVQSCVGYFLWVEDWEQWLLTEWDEGRCEEEGAESVQRPHCNHSHY